jgi:hypothetical protein
MLTRETVTFQDGDGWSWEFDLTFMLSNYECIWGRGCPDTRLEHTARGCYVDGVEIYRGHGDTSGRDELKKIRRRVRELTDEDWQNRRVALQRGGRDPWGKARFKPDTGGCFAGRAEDRRARRRASPVRPARSTFAGIELAPASPSAGEQGFRTDRSRRSALRAGPVAQVANGRESGSSGRETCNEVGAVIIAEAGCEDTKAPRPRSRSRGVRVGVDFRLARSTWR